jgi:hypothetical protein
VQRAIRFAASARRPDMIVYEAVGHLGLLARPPPRHNLRCRRSRRNKSFDWFLRSYGNIAGRKRRAQSFGIETVNLKECLNPLATTHPNS